MSKKLFITSLPSNTTKDSLHGLFSQFGPIKSLNLIKDVRTNKCKGFAFLVFENSPSAKNAISASLRLNGRRLTVQHQSEGKKLQKEKKELKRRRLYIGNLPRGTTDEVLNDTFSKYGLLESAFVIKNPDTGKPNNYGYVTFIKKRDMFKVFEGNVKIFGVVVKCRPFGDKKGEVFKQLKRNKKKGRQDQKHISTGNHTAPLVGNIAGSEPPHHQFQDFYYAKRESGEFQKERRRDDFTKRENIKRRKAAPRIKRLMERNPIMFSGDHKLLAKLVIDTSVHLTNRNANLENLRLNLKEREREEGSFLTLMPYY